MRHAKAKDQEFGQTDFERPLKKRGVAEAEFIGNLLKTKEEYPQSIVASSARRTTETAEIVAKILGYALEEIRLEGMLYQANTSHCQKLIAELDPAIQSVLVVGHNPTISEWAAQLSSHGSLHFPTGTIAKIILPFDDWQHIYTNEGKLAWWQYSTQETD